MASASTNPPDDDPNPETGEGGEGGEEGPPPPDPAIDSDVNGDDHADIVTLHTSGVAHTLNAFDAADKATPFGGGMNSALFDSSEHHVVDVSDVNGDHHADLITLCFNSPIGINNAVCVFPGHEDNSFGSGILARGGIVPGTHGPNGHEPIGVADVTGDGRGDLVSFYAPQGNLYVYPGLENGQFGDGKTVGGGQVNSALFDRVGTYFVDVADVNGDGSADLVGLSSSGKAEVFFGTPWGLHQAPFPIGPTVDPIMDNGTGHEPIGVADVDEDGKADLVTLNPSGSISVYPGVQADNQYLSTTATTSHSGLNSSLLDETGDDFVGLLDRTGDGHADLIKVTSEGVIYSASGQGDLKFGEFTYFANGNTPNRFAKAGFEQVFEKPFIRRIGCSAAGCVDRPRAMESDVDADLRSDLVTLDSGGTSHIYRAIGDVGHKTSFGGGMNPALFDGAGHHVIDVADVNGDWRSDKVTLHDNGNVYVHPGKSDGTFDTGVSSFVGLMKPGPYSPTGFEPIAVADVTGDTLADLVAFKEGQGIKVYTGNTNSTFSAPIISLPGSNSALHDGTGYHFVDVVDVTGDRRADLVASGEQDGTVRVFKGNTNGTFVLDGVSNLPLKLGEAPGQELVGLGDVNGDKRADLATLVSGTVHVYEGKAGGEFATEDAGGPSPTASSFSGSLDSNLFDKSGDEIVGLLDENGDRKADLVAVRSDGTARIYQGRANFTFDTSAKVRTLAEFSPTRFRKLQPGHEVVNEKPAALRAGCTPFDCPWPPIVFNEREGDLTGDYRSDLVTVDSAGTAYVYRGTREGFASGAVKSLEGQLNPAMLDGIGHYVIDTSDVTGEGRTDLVSVKDDGKVFVYPGSEEHTFGSAVETGVSVPPVMNKAGDNEPIAVADVTGEGRGDLIVFVGPGSGKISVYKGLSTGKFETTPAVSLSGELDSALLDKTGSYFVDAGDVTGDGRADLVAMNTNSYVYVHKGQADGKFAAATAVTSIYPIMDDGAGNEPVALGDMNADGRSDLLLVSDEMYGPSQVFAMKGQTNGTFTSTGLAHEASFDSSLLGGPGQELVGLFDYNRDSRGDLLVLEAGNFKLYPASADFRFATGSPITLPGVPTSARHAAGGYEFPGEKPFLRRAGCTASGCEWPRKPTVDAAPEVISDSEVKLKASVNPYGVETKYRFEWGTTISYGNKAPASDQSVGSGSAFVDVSQTITGLSPHVTYHYRVVATNVNGTFYGADRLVETTKPVVSTGTATEALPLSAVLVGNIDPEGTPTSYFFEYGQTRALGSKSHIVPASAGSGSTPYNVYRELQGLEPGSIYYYRIVASNLHTTVRGEIKSVELPGLSINHPGSGMPCGQEEYSDCVMDFGGEYTVFHPSGNVNCEDQFAMEVNADGRIEVTDHYAYSCAMWPCFPQGDGAWHGRVGRYQSGYVQFNLRGCTKSEWVERQGDFELSYEGDYEGSKLKAYKQNFQTQEEFETFGATSIKFESEWDSGDHVQFEELEGAGPEVSTGDPTAVTSNSAQLQGTIAQTTMHEAEYWFEYGPTSELGLNAPEPGQDWGYGTVSKTVEGLAPGRTYYYRLVARTPAGTALGAIKTLKTSLGSDVDQDGRSDLVALDPSGVARVYAGTASGILGGSPKSSLSGIDPALLDGTGYYAVDVADVTGEGRADLITIGSGGGVYVYPGNTDRSFGSGAMTATGKFAMNGLGPNEPIAVADLTSEGRADYVGFAQSTGGFVVVPGKADGGFDLPKVAYSLNGTLDSALLDASGHYFLDAIDVTGDGFADVVSLNTDGKAYVFKGEAGGKLAAPKEAATINPIMDNGTGQEPIGLGDVTGDGRADLLTLDGTTLKLWAGKEDGTFATATTPYGSAIDSALLDGVGEELVGLLDYSRDGRADLVSVRDDGTPITYTAQSGATFASPTINEGDLDSVRGLRPNGLEFATQKPLIRRHGCAATGCRWYSRPAKADTIGDGRSNLVSVHSSKTAYIWGGNVIGTTPGAPTLSFEGSLDPALLDQSGHYAIDVADVTGEGRADLITTPSTGGLTVYAGKPDRSLATAVSTAGGKSMMVGGAQEPIAVADVTTDGRADYIGFVQTTGGLASVPSKGDGTFDTTKAAYSLNGTVDTALLDQSGHYFLDAIDVTGDKIADVVSIKTDGKAYVFKGKSTGEFEAPKEAATIDPIMDNGTGQEPIGLGDMTGDGRADLLTLEGTTLKLWAGKEDGTFAAATEPYGSAIDSNLMDGSGEELIGLLDQSRDGLADLTSVTSTGVIKVYVAQSGGTFTAPISASLGATSIRGTTTGHEFVTEKPMLRRAGCEAAGCQWP